MQITERTGSSDDYRYGYQGSEKDNEVKGEGNSYTTHYRLLDVRIGKWLSRDPKFTAFETPYSSMSNNPIMYNDKLGDSIKTIFKGRNNEKLSQVIKAVQKMFNTEYGVKVGYNNKTKMLYYDGDVETDLPVSPSARRDLINALVETDPKKIKKYGELQFGYNLGNYDGSGPMQFGGANRFTPIAGIDVDDFNSDGSAKGYKYNNLPIRAYNMARVFEHEFFGHIIGQVGDNPFGVRDEVNPGGAEDIINKYRVELNLPIRINYGVYYRSAIFFGDNALNKTQAKEVAKQYYDRLKEYVEKNKGSVEDIPMILTPKENR